MLLSAQSIIARANAARASAAGPLSSPSVQASLALSAAHLEQEAAAVRNQTAAQAAASASAALFNNGAPLSGLQCSPQCDPNPLDPTQTQPTDPTQWTNANVPVKSGATETVTQTAQNAVLTWSKFNLYTGETLNFNQGGNADWSVLNRVLDPSTAPSQIFGAINAPGSVYVINRNGIIFGGTAQVNVHNLIASSLDVGDPTMTIAERNQFFLANGIANPTSVPGHFSFSYNTSDTPITTDPVGDPNQNPEGDVIVNRGAVINANIAPSISPDAGGFVYLFAPDVTNNGSITTPAGETMMVAAQVVQLTPGAYIDGGIGSGGDLVLALPQTNFRGTGVNFTDPTLFPTGPNGLPLAAPWALSGSAQITAPGSVTNNGYIDAPRGIVILNGDDVTNGANAVIAADTSISRDGQIFLDARLNLTLAANSTLQLLPDETGETLTVSSIGAFQPGAVELQGNVVDFEPGSLLIAPGATVDAIGTELSTTAPTNIELPPAVVSTAIYPQSLKSLADAQSQTPASIYMAPGSAIDVSGLDDVVEPMSANFLSFKPFGNEFADQPLQRNGILVGQSLTVDIRTGTPLADVSGLIGALPVSLDELLTTGGNVSLSFANQNAAPTVASAPGQIVTQPGSSINVAGGYLRYLSGPNPSTYLLTSDGRVVNIGDASPLQTYVAIAGVSDFDQPRWGLSETFIDPLFSLETEPGYIEGRDAGTIALNGTAFALAGSLNAGVIDGELQNLTGVMEPASIAHTAAGLGVPNDLPTAGAFFLTNSDPTNVTPLTIAENAPTLPANFGATQPLPPGLAADMLVSAPLLSAGNFAQIELGTGTALNSAFGTPETVSQIGGAVTVEPGADLTVVPGGSISITAASADIEGDLTAHSGAIAITTTSTAGLPGQAPSASAPGPFNLVVGSGAVLDTSGLWVNDRGANAGSLVGGAFVNGGSITLLTDNNAYQDAALETPTQPGFVDLTGNIILKSGSLLNVSSGGRVLPTGAVQTDSLGRPVGAGGNVTLETYATGWVDGGTVGNGQTAPTTAAPSATVIFGAAGGSSANIAAALNSTIHAFGFEHGGSLTIQAPTIQIGGTAPSDPSTIYLPQSFFAGNAFGSYSLSSVVGGTTVAAGTLALQQQNYLASAALDQLPTGGDPASVVGTGFLPIGLRAPVSLTLAATLPGVPFEPYDPPPSGTPAPAPQVALSIAAGAVIDADPCTLNGACAAIDIDVAGIPSSGSNFPPYLVLQQTGVADIGGAIHAPGGTIALNAGTPLTNGQIWLEPTAVLDVSGEAIVNPLQTRFTTGTVLAGGTVNIVASGQSTQTALVALPGSLIDVAGATGVFDLPNNPAGSNQAPLFLPQTVWSNAGSINLAGNTLLFDGTIEATPGTSEGSGGSLTISSPLSQGSITVKNGLETTGLQLAHALPTGATGLFFDPEILAGSGIAALTLTAGDTAGDSAVAVNSTGNYRPGTITFVDTVNIGGLQSLALDASTITLAASKGTTAAPDVTLQANYVALRGIGANLKQATLGADPGTLQVSGETIDIATGGATGTSGGQQYLALSNVKSASFVSSGDIRFRVPLDTIAQDQPMVGGLYSAGDMTFDAQQIYPASAVDFTLKSQGTITFGSTGTAPALPLSAGGALTVDALNIVQDGTVLAPLGTLRLGAETVADLSPNDPNTTLVPTQSVTFGNGSVTSVSLNGLIVPFGQTADDANWSYNSASGIPLADPPAKDLVVTGASISMAPGATINLSGGGDIEASEFVQGTGGTVDVLSSASAGTSVFAIIPGYNPEVAPFDIGLLTTQVSVNGASVNAGNPVPTAGSSVYLSGGPGLAAGFYTLLPAGYATLPGAYRVTVLANSTDAISSNNAVLQDGTIVTAGHLANTEAGTQAARSMAFEVQSSSVWRQYSEVDETLGNSYFAQSKFANANGELPQLPVDAGNLVLAPTTALNLAGTFLTAPGAGGRGAQVDVAAQDIEIVAPGATAAAGYVAVDATQLTDIGADSLLIGGIRGTGADTGEITPVADSVVVDNNAQAPLAAPQVILTTTPGPTTDPNSNVDLQVDGGSVIEAAGGLKPGDITTYTIGSANVHGDGSLLAVSSGAPITIEREDLTTSLIGRLNILAGATVTGASITLDSSDLIEAQGATLTAANYNVSANAISFGAKQHLNGGFGVTSDILAQLEQAQTLTLSTYPSHGNGGEIHFNGTSSLVLSKPNSTLTFNTGAVVADNGGTIDIGAGTVNFANPNQTAPAIVAGNATLNVNAKSIEFGGGDKVFSGFASAILNATQEVGFNGAGSLESGAANLAFNAPLILVGAGAQQTVTTAGNVSFGQNGVNTASAEADLGGTFAVNAAAISDDTLIQALAGGVTLEATTGDVSLGSNAAFLASGYTQNFFNGVTEFASGGTVQLIADHGNLDITQGAAIDVSSCTPGVACTLGNAGQVMLSAANGGLFYFTPPGSASGPFGFLVDPNAGDGGGSLMVDLQTSAGLVVPSLFSDTINIHVADGNFVLASNLTAQNVTLTADTGLLLIDTTIDASGSAGGNIDLWGGQGVVLGPDANLVATASDPTQQGGEVVIGTDTAAENGSGSDGVIDLAGGTIDVANIANAGNDGTVRLRAPLTAAGNDVPIDPVATNIVGARSVTVEGYKVFSTTNGSGFNGVVDPLNDPAFYGPGGTLVTFVQDFGLSAAAQQKFASVSNVVYQPGIELDNPDLGTNGGNITVASNWNLGAGVAGDLVNAAAFTIGSGKSKITVPAGTVVTDANGNLLPQYATYTGQLAFVAGTSEISSLYYRVGGSVTGEAPAITLRAANNVDINADITDGFFQTENRNDPKYIGLVNAYIANAYNNGNTIAISDDGGYILAGAIGAPPLAPYIAAANAVSPVATSEDPAPVAGADLFPLTSAGDAIGSSSYRIVAGADMTSANPLALQPLATFADSNGTALAGQGNVTINGSTDSGLIPTIVRTGNGSIDVAAARDVVMADTTAPGVIYTAGVNSPNLPAADFTLPSGSSIPVAGDPNGFLEPQLLSCSESFGCVSYGVITAPAYPVDGGNLTVVAQQDIIGSELPAVVSDVNNAKGDAAHQYFWPWLITQSSALSDTVDGAFSPLSAFLSTGTVFTPQQTSWWINFGTFDQGLMSVGGNVTVIAGRDISRLGVSEPTTARFSGGLSSTSLPVENLNPSGNLTVIAGRDLLSGTFYEGSGTGTIRVGGSVESDWAFKESSGNVPVSTLLAVDTGTIALTARGSIDIAGVVSATSLQDVIDTSGNSVAFANSPNVAPSMWVSSYGPDSSVSLTSVSGAVDINTLVDPSVLLDPRSLSPTGINVNGSLAITNFPGVTDDPANFEAVALLGDVNVEDSMVLAASETGSLDLLAWESLRTYAVDIAPNFQTPPFAIVTGPSIIEQVFDPADPLSGFAPGPGSLADAGPLLLHTRDPNPDLFDAVNGDIISGPATGGDSAVPSTVDPLSWEVDKPALVQAGLDILDLSYFGQNLLSTDVTQIKAGRDILYTGEWETGDSGLLLGGVIGPNRPNNGVGFNDGGLSLAGPGFFDIEAGRNLGPFVTAAADAANFSFNQNATSNAIGTGIITFGNTVTVGNRMLFDDQNPNLANAFGNEQNNLMPQEGADIVALFGVGKGIDYQAVISQYVNPATASSATTAALQVFMDAIYQSNPAMFAESPLVPPTTAIEAWNDFNNLPAQDALLKNVFVDSVFFNVLQAAGDTKQYADGYQIIDTLFPTALGYTNNCPDTSCPGAPPPLSGASSGTLDMLHATIKTLQSTTVALQPLGGFPGESTAGGDIYIFGPGGDIDVGSTATEINKNLQSSALGILTLDGGVIDTFTDGSVLVDQSRILTVQGGNILMWSSNGNLDAGRGSKSTVDFTPLTVFFDNDDVQFLNLSGLVTGAGIGTLQATPDAPAASATLIAPRGAVNAGAAGLRSSGSLVIAAAQVINAANISVAGTVTGVSQAATVNLGSLEAGSSAAGQSSSATDSVANALNRVAPASGQSVPSIITVEVLGYGDCNAPGANDCR